MACIDCDTKMEYVTVCRVCFLLDGDKTHKPCTYCHTCAAYICERDRKDYIRRGLAFVKKNISS